MPFKKTPAAKMLDATPKTTDTGVSPNNVIEPAPLGVINMSHGDVCQFQCELRSETPTMIKAMIAGQPRAFEKKYLTGWTVTQANAGNPATVVMKMSPEQAKKWKLK